MDSFNAPNQGGLLGLLAAIFGANKVEGGPTVGPDGRIIPTPFHGSSGFLGGNSRRLAAEYNANLYDRALAGQSARDIAEIQGRYGIKGKKVEGREARLTDTNKAQQDILVNKARALDALMARANLNPNNPEHVDQFNRLALEGYNREQGLNKKRDERKQSYLDTEASQGPINFGEGLKDSGLTPQNMTLNQGQIGVMPQLGGSILNNPAPMTTTHMEGTKGFTDPKTGKWTPYEFAPMVNQVAKQPGFIPQSSEGARNILQGQAPYMPGTNDVDFNPGFMGQGNVSIGGNSLSAMPRPNPLPVQAPVNNGQISISGMNVPKPIDPLTVNLGQNQQPQGLPFGNSQLPVQAPQIPNIPNQGPMPAGSMFPAQQIPGTNDPLSSLMKFLQIYGPQVGSALKDVGSNAWNYANTPIKDLTR